MILLHSSGSVLWFNTRYISPIGTYVVVILLMSLAKSSREQPWLVLLKQLYIFWVHWPDDLNKPIALLSLIIGLGNQPHGWKWCWSCCAKLVQIFWSLPIWAIRDSVNRNLSETWIFAWSLKILYQSLFLSVWMTQRDHKGKNICGFDSKVYLKE